MASETVFATASPATGEALEAIEATSLEAIPEVVSRAREAQLAWAELSLEKRIKAISKVKARILERGAEIAKMITAETGKPEAEALLGEVLASADVVAWWAEALPDELEPIDAELDALAYPKKSGAIRREARGVIAVIMPWNFPFALPLRTIIPALMVGNAVVFKPSEVTPRSGRLIGALFDGIVPDGLVGIVQGGGEAGARLCSADVDYVVFTGSTSSGRKVAHACADRLVPCALELGGKDAAIVLADADLERAANGIVWGAMMNAGQNCAAVERVYVESKIAKAFTDKLVEKAKALRLGTDIGPLTSEAQRDVVARHVSAAKDAGGEVLTGGEPVSEKGAKLGFAPTVVKIDAEESPLVADETFGPVLPITEVADVDEAIKRANGSRFGLTASIWTKDVSRGEKLASRLRAGVVTINNHAFTGAVPSLPWSGFGESGWGVTGSVLALEHLTRPRLVLVDKNRAPRETWWYPYTPTLTKLARAFVAVRGGAKGLGARIGAVFALVSALLTRTKELRTGKPAETK